MSLQAALIEHGSPTLAGLKPASLFRVQPEDEADFVAQFLSCRRELEGRGLVLTLLKGCRKTGAYLVYLYRKAELEALLGRGEHADFLREMGYAPWKDSRGCLRQLAARLCLEGEFPHEIGVFLGYPLADVKGFIRHKGKNFTLCGCWKCYGDPKEAARQFRRFKDCTSDYRRRFAHGATLRQLTVAA
ncbi:DUF3793 family protein [uncultured Flavonifractor sp.]|uniref:DUF3793 family protein n=1 Tax=uncultured Flavonifractor sp. TaxID=1193534 RepID=UPI00260AA227|nr:DUF3793 family protein [uncultured Flavonifractor sp.]